MGKYEDDVMDTMNAEDSLIEGGQSIDLFDKNKRWGTDTPLDMQVRKFDPSQPSSLDPSNLRWWAEMNPVVGAISGAEKILNEGKWVEGGLLIGGAVIPASTVAKVFGPAVRAGKNLVGKIVNGRYVSKDVVQKWDNILNQADENLRMDRINIDREDAIMRRKTSIGEAQAHWDKVDRKIAVSKRSKIGEYEKSHKLEQNLINRKKEGREAYYKMEHYWQTSDLGLEPFLKQSKGDRDLALMMRKNYLRDEALNKGIISNKESEIILATELGGNWSQYYDDLYGGIGLKRDGAKIRKEVEEILKKGKEFGSKGDRYSTSDVGESFREGLERLDKKYNLSGDVPQAEIMKKVGSVGATPDITDLLHRIDKPLW